MLALKLALVAASVLLSTAVARRWGHTIGGTVAGLPMIAAPIVAILLVDQGAEAVRAIALATLACLPAAIVHIVSIAHTAFRWAWPLCLLAALALYLACGAALTWAALPPAAVMLLALAAPSIGLWLAPRTVHAAGPVRVPRTEMVLRVAAALAMAAAVILGAAVLPAAISGLLLAVPITGSVLPCFTLPRYGAQATASLMGGFVMGLHGFAAFFGVLYLALGSVGPLPAFVLSLATALAVAATLQWLRRPVERSAH